MINKIIIFTVAIIISSFTIISGCAARQTPVQLPSVEIREYQGENLSSINDFWENSIKGPQFVDIANYTLKIHGLVATPAEYTYDQILKNKAYKKVSTLDCVEGWGVTLLWEGFKVEDLLAKSAPLDTASVIVFRSYDGYSTSFPLEYIMNNDILMAYKMNEVVIPPQRGFPFQLVAESKWGYKWIKWITEIELSDDINHKGYWESAGYSNSADRDKYFFDD